VIQSQTSLLVQVFITQDFTICSQGLPYCLIGKGRAGSKWGCW